MANKKETLSALQKATKALNAMFAADKKKSTKFSKGKKIKHKFDIVEDESGQILKYATLEVGAEVEVATGDGSAPAADGWYKVEGDIEIYVEDGAISDIVYPEGFDLQEDAENAENAASVAEVAAVVTEAVDELTSLKEENEELKKQLEELKKLVEDVPSSEEISEMKDEVKALTEVVLKAAKMPNSFSKVEKSSNYQDARVKELAGLLGRSKK